jgi:8-oxo-dGTP diphosphatase
VLPNTSKEKREKLGNNKFIRESGENCLKRNRFVGIILVNPEGKVLLQLRCKDELLYPNCWTLPGGKVEEGESPELAIAREAKEELGLDLRNPVLFKTIVENASDAIIERYIYWGNIRKKAQDLELGEGVALRYFSSEEIPLLKIAFDLKPAITKFLKTHQE